MMAASFGTLGRIGSATVRHWALASSEDLQNGRRFPALTIVNPFTT
jgi:predicted nucleic acid-binding protein